MSQVPIGSNHRDGYRNGKKKPKILFFFRYCVNIKWRERKEMRAEELNYYYFCLFYSLLLVCMFYFANLWTTTQLIKKQKRSRLG